MSIQDYPTETIKYGLVNNQKGSYFIGGETYYKKLVLFLVNNIHTN